MLQKSVLNCAKWSEGLTSLWRPDAALFKQLRLALDSHQHQFPGSGHEKIFWKLRARPDFQLVFHEQCWKMPKSMLRLCDHNTADPHYRLFKKNGLTTHIDTSLMLQGPRHMGKAWSKTYKLVERQGVFSLRGQHFVTDGCRAFGKAWPVQWRSFATSQTPHQMQFWILQAA